jgi:cobalt-zinc-cadmium efflux system protein
VSDGNAEREPHGDATRHALRTALWLNVALSASLMTAGVVADSSGLIANALDNTSDAAVYTISYYAATRGARWKVRAARLSGVMLLLLSSGVLLDVGRRFISGSEPVSAIMIAMTVVAAAINVVCLKLLRRSRHDDVSLRAAWTFSINDFVSNLGLLVAGILVAWLGRAWPDLVLGVAIALVTAKGGVEILADARRAGRHETS